MQPLHQKDLMHAGSLTAGAVVPKPLSVGKVGKISAGKVGKLGLREGQESQPGVTKPDS